VPNVVADTAPIHNPVHTSLFPTAQWVWHYYAKIFYHLRSTTCLACCTCLQHLRSPVDGCSMQPKCVAAIKPIVKLLWNKLVCINNCPENAQY